MKRLVIIVLVAFAATTTAHARCDDERRVEKVTESGRIVELDDGSRWEVEEMDRDVAERWLQDAPITACDHELINQEDHETARARQTKEPEL
ncbi:MAG: hypothetical protein JO227_10770 [Acetobacteraceae bacterium]|nr:hypothetical protein [Acetobacteraceae bacterium]